MPIETAKEVENIKNVERFFDEDWNKRSVAVIDEMYSPNIQYHGPSTEFHTIRKFKELANILQDDISPVQRLSLKSHSNGIYFWVLKKPIHQSRHF